MLNNKNHSNNFENIINLLVQEKIRLEKTRNLDSLFEAVSKTDNSGDETENVDDVIKNAIKSLNKNKNEILKLNSRKFNSLLREIRKADNQGHAQTS